jgi:protein gp37
MSENTAISWTDHTFNPWIGCTKVSPGCANCYAATQDNLRKWTPDGWGKGKPRKRTSEGNWKDPLKWNRDVTRKHFQQVELRDGTIHRGYIDRIKALQLLESDIIAAGPARPRVFCASLADWLDDEVPIEWLMDLLDLIRRTPHLDWLLLTKRPQDFHARLQTILDLIPKTGIELQHAILRCRVDLMQRGWQTSTYTDPEIGRENYWIGTTVEDQKRADERIPALLEIPARVRFLSCEPLLEKVELPIHHQSMGPDHADFHWVITGGESGPGFRPFNPDWARSLRNQCKAAGVAFHMKQMGGMRSSTMPPIPDDLMIREWPNSNSTTP